MNINQATLDAIIVDMSTLNRDQSLEYVSSRNYKHLLNEEFNDLYDYFAIEKSLMYQIYRKFDATK